MKITYIYKCFFVALVALLVSSCNNTDAEQKFDQTPTDRLNSQKTELKDALLSSEFGWKAIYFTDNTVLGGYTHLFRFSADGNVEMASDFDNDTAIYKSEYEIQLGSTVSVVFTTKNRIHLLSESDNFPIAALRGKGYLGDFQFLYYGQENGEIIFKANRNLQEIRFVKATAQDWTNLSQNLLMEQNVIGADTRPLFRLLETNDGAKKHQFDFSFSPITRFAESNSLETGFSVNYNFGVGYTPRGIVISPAIEVGGQKLTDFVYNDADGSFTATGTAGVNAVIKYSDKPLVLTDDYKILLPGNTEAGFGYIAANLAIAPTNSQLSKEIIDRINTGLPANQKLSRVQFIFNSDFGSYIEYRFSGGKETLYHTVTVSENANLKTIVLTDEYWDNGAAIIPAPAFLKEIDDELTNSSGLYVKKENFKIQFTNNIYTFTSAASNFRITTYAFQ